MIPINNSDTAWLIVSDYNQENGLPYEDLREDILNPNSNNGYWDWESGAVGVGGHNYNGFAIGGNGIGESVGSIKINNTGGVGGETPDRGGLVGVLHTINDRVGSVTHEPPAGYVLPRNF